MSRASTRLNAKPGVMNSLVLPTSSPVRTTVSSTRTVVVPTASTLRAAAIRPHSAVVDRVPLAVDLVLLDDGLGERSERVETDVQRHASGLQPLDESKA